MYMLYKTVSHTERLNDGLGLVWGGGLLVDMTAYSSSYCSDAAWSAVVDEVHQELFRVHYQHQQLGVVHPKLPVLCRIITDQLLAVSNGVVSQSSRTCCFITVRIV